MEPRALPTWYSPNTTAPHPTTMSPKKAPENTVQGLLVYSSIYLFLSSSQPWLPSIATLFIKWLHGKINYERRLSERLQDKAFSKGMIQKKRTVSSEWKQSPWVRAGCQGFTHEQGLWRMGRQETLTFQLCFKEGHKDTKTGVKRNDYG